MNRKILTFVSLLLALLLSLSLFAACKNGNEQQPGDTASDGDPTTVDPDSVDAEGHQLPQPTISVARIQGTYVMSGTQTWDDFEDDSLDETEEHSFTMNVFPGGENSLSITVIPDDDEPSETYTVTDYDPPKGTCTLFDENLEIRLCFSESGGKIAVSLSFDRTYEEARVSGSYTGTKK